MKPNWMLTIIAVALFAFSGCSKKSEVDTAPIEKSFASAEPATKSSADQAISAIKSGNYAGALAELQKLGAQVKLTPEQKQAVQDVIAQVQKQLSETVSQAGKEAEKAAGDLQKSLKK
jgi:outer membrane protein assembly factor BamD (BamD/ComL family)